MKYVEYIDPKVLQKLLDAGDYESAAKLYNMQADRNLIDAHNRCCEQPLPYGCSAYSSDFAIYPKPGCEGFVDRLCCIVMFHPEPEYSGIYGDMELYYKHIVEYDAKVRALFAAWSEI